MFQIDIERPADAPAIERLLDLTFGPHRHRKASYQFRCSVPHRADLARAARRGGDLVGTIRYWPILIDGHPALLLGPLGVEPALRGLGIGRELVRTTCSLAAQGGTPVLLVGDLAYYGPLGFVPADTRVVMPDERPERVLALGPLARVPTGRLAPLVSTGERATVALPPALEG